MLITGIGREAVGGGGGGGGGDRMKERGYINTVS